MFSTWNKYVAILPPVFPGFQKWKYTLIALLNSVVSELGDRRDLSRNLSWLSSRQHYPRVKFPVPQVLSTTPKKDYRTFGFPSQNRE